MLNPPINQLLKKVDSRYTLVIAAAKRAREIIEGEEGAMEVGSNKPVTVATHEIANDRIVYKQNDL